MSPQPPPSALLLMAHAMGPLVPPASPVFILSLPPILAPALMPARPPTQSYMLRRAHWLPSLSPLSVLPLLRGQPKLTPVSATISMAIPSAISPHPARLRYLQTAVVSGPPVPPPHQSDIW